MPDDNESEDECQTVTDRASGQNASNAKYR